MKVNTILNVTIYDPKNNTVGKTREFPIMLLPNETAKFIPNQTAMINDTAKFVDVYPFDAVGTYKIAVDSKDPTIYFYRFFPKEDGSHCN